MSDDIEKAIYDATKGRRVLILSTIGDLYQYLEEDFVAEWVDPDGDVWEAHWASRGDLSGYYQSAAEAERAARVEIPWLRADNSN
jgi:hypothetical protein